jgi:DNA-binding response OmpR family regulator
MQRGSVQALCVGRHAFLSDHLGRLFGELGLTTTCAVGIEGARAAARRCRPDLVICDYDLLATGALEPWESDSRLSRVPVLAVSLTRRQDEMHLLDVNEIGAFLYLPTMTARDLRQALAGVLRPAAPPASFSLPAAVDLSRPASSVR